MSMLCPRSLALDLFANQITAETLQIPQSGPLDIKSNGFLLFTKTGTLLDTLVEHGRIHRYDILSEVISAHVDGKTFSRYGAFFSQSLARKPYTWPMTW